ncbi:ABC transporter substrate-binding protein [Fusibacter ferrireducens]|uniref:ABC transporter substrate-binding protein n=1 Tax=Fusibacter ferrireducens TaxID=2785058 RepID=A0ABR9ZUE9_9FIRM|nr:ABC transporter substrate-binding protein [Fusibacter ferrireducens]MBF4694102.1 ABC transporter substrate-binding protein [Fusibacter ferrireducens]
MNIKLYNRHTQHHNQSKMVLMFIIIAFFSGVILFSCEKKPIRIGFIGDLTSKNSQLSIDARNAVEYAMNQVNEKGGINGRMLELVVKDDHADTATALEMDQAFIKEDVHFVIGHMHSNMAEAMKQSASDQLLFVSPTMGTDALSRMDDFIIRTAPLNSEQANLFCEHCIEHNLKDLVIVCDLMNQEYTKTVAGSVQEILVENHMAPKAIIDYDSRRDDLKKIVNQVIAEKPSTLLLLSQATDSAYFVQGVKKEMPNINIYSVPWSMTKDFIVNGGKYAEGTHFIGVYHPERESQMYLSFSEGFEKVYNYKPSFASVLGADAFQTLYLGLKGAQELTPTDVKQAIIDTNTIQGLQEEFSIDAFGDDTKGYMFFELIDGKYVPIRE